jgi:group I intron endonuclease
MSGIIYLTRNLVSGKLYVGLHTIGKPDYLGSGKYLKRAIRKYGRKNFSRTDLDTFIELEEGRAKERHWIAALNSKAPNGYNLCDGGEGVFNPCQDVRDRIAEKSSIRMMGNHNALGHQMSDTGKAKLRATHIGLHPNDVTRAKMGAASRGNKRALGYRHTDEAKARIRAAMMGSTNGKNSIGFRGPHTAASKAKMSIAHRGIAWSPTRQMAEEQRS